MCPGRDIGVLAWYVFDQYHIRIFEISRWSIMRND